MTPQERQLVVDLFARLAALEQEPRDPDAEQVIREGLAKAPHAVYALVQTVLVQDEALKTADAHIRELEAALQGGPDAGAQPEGQPKGFLDNMRDALFGRGEPSRGSVPSVRPGEPMGVPPQYRDDPQYRAGSAWGGAAAPGPMAPQSAGGSFLGTAAAAAAGVIGGGLLLNGIRNMLGGYQHHGPFAGAFDEIASGGSRAPWGGAENSELAREAGIDDIGGGGRRAGLFDAGEQGGDDRAAGLYDAADETELDNSDVNDVDGSDDTDYA